MPETIESQQCQHEPTTTTELLEQEEWLETLTNIAENMVRGCQDRELRNYLRYIAYYLRSTVDPDKLEDDVVTVVRRAYRRVYKTKRSLTQEIEDFVMTTNGNFLTTDVYQVTTLTTREEKKKASVVLSRLKEKGIIKPVGNRAGMYRRVTDDLQPEDWLAAADEAAQLWLPLQLHDKATIYPGDIVLVMGSPNAGKSAFMMNVAKENRQKYDIHYFSSELRPATFKRRMCKFDVPVANLGNIKFYHNIVDFADAVKTGEGNLNIIDYIELHNEFWKISEILDEIFKKLDGAILVAAIQKDPRKEYGLGGSFTQQKPVLTLGLDNGKAKIMKCKEWPEKSENPNGQVYEFKLVNGCKFMRKHMELGWHREVSNGV